MKLSMSIIAQELPYITLERGSGRLRFSGCELLCAGGELEPDVLYITRAGHIPAAIQAPNGGGAVCVGRVPLSMLPGLEVLTVDENVDVIRLVNAVSAVFRKYDRLDEALREAAGRPDPALAVLRQAAPLFAGNKLTLLGDSGRVLACVPDEPSGPDCGERLEAAFPGGKLMLSAVRRPFCVHDGAVLEHIASFLRPAPESIQAGQETEPRLAVLLRELLRGGGELYELSQELYARSWHRKDGYVCLCMDRHGGLTPNALNRMWPDVCAFEYEGRIVCLGNLAGEDFFRKKRELFSQRGLTAGVSDRFDDILELAPACTQSRIALEHGGEGSIVEYSDCALDYMLGSCTGELDAKHAASWKLRVLMEHDARTGSAYCRSLYSYIRCGMNTMHSARELYIHRSTMAYRLKRIRELTGLKLDDARELLYIHLSIVLLWDEMKRLDII
ncbi:MAG: PucR family transcriptional regulator [Candidatus Heteroscillospira sp.]|jgi:hypothetical protein